MLEQHLDDLCFEEMLLGEILLSLNAIQSRDLEKALVVQEQLGGRLGAILVRSGSLSESNLIDALSKQLGTLCIPADIPVPPHEVIKHGLDRLGLGIEWLLKQEAIVWFDEEALYCLLKDPLSTIVEETLHRRHQGKVTYVLAKSQLIDSLLSSVKMEFSEGDYSLESNTDIQQLRELAEEAPVVELVNNIISQALEERASDIHIEPEEDTFDVRYRVDGVMHTHSTLPKQRYYAVASRLKLVSGLDIAERRLPQDGRISTRANGIELDIRVSSLPGVNGESVVMRLMPKERKDLFLDKLGFLPDHLTLMRRWIDRPHGIVLVTGPTGSGKSTTLYSALDESNDGVKKIITVEDPVEFKLPHVTQVQVHSDIGLTFAGALRSILRQDPDVIMIGEIRDLETAEIAVQSALTGHLVLSTLHTNDSLSAFTRLIDMGVEPFLAATPVIAVQAQRLVRTLCEHCSVSSEPSVSELKRVEAFAHQLFPGQAAAWKSAVGCAHCQNTGYKGRVGIYELVEVSESLREKVTSQASIAVLKEQALKEGYRDLRMDGLIKAWLGITSVDEVYRVTSLHA